MAGKAAGLVHLRAGRDAAGRRLARRRPRSGRSRLDRPQHPPARRVRHRRQACDRPAAALRRAHAALRGNVTQATLRRLFKPETLGAVGKTKREATPRAGLKILRDSWGVAPRLRQDRLRRDVGRGVGRRRGPRADPAADPRAGPDRRARRARLRPVARVRPEHADRDRAGPRVHAPPRAERQAAAEGGRRLHRRPERVPEGLEGGLPAVEAQRHGRRGRGVLAGQYGVGGGDETRRAELLAELEVSLGATEGRRVWNDLREQQDPETPVTALGTFNYGHNTSESGQRDPRRRQRRARRWSAPARPRRRGSRA